MKKRIAIWIQGGIGGGNFSQGQPPLPEFVEALSTEHAVTVYSILPANDDYAPKGFNVRSVNKRIRPTRIRSAMVCLLFLWDHLNKPYSLIHAIWAYPAGTMAVILAKLVRIPSVVTVQGGEAAAIPSLRYGHMLNPSLKKITLWTCRQATCLCSISTFLVSRLEAHGLTRKNISIIPWGPDITLFKKHEKNNNALLRIIHIGNLTEVKDQVTLLKAFALIVKQSPAELRIIGDGTLKGELQGLIEETGLTAHVKILGAIPHTQLPDYYAWADMMLHTSLHEGQSVVVVEAMACGVVVCGTRVGILYDLGDDYFETVDVGDYQALATKVLRLWNDQDRYHEKKEKAFAWTRKFNASWTVKEYSTLYSSLVENGNRKN